MLLLLQLYQEILAGIWLLPAGLSPGMKRAHGQHLPLFSEERGQDVAHCLLSANEEGHEDLVLQRVGGLRGLRLTIGFDLFQSCRMFGRPGLAMSRASRILVRSSS